MSINNYNNFGVSLGNKKIFVEREFKKLFSLETYKKAIQKTGPKILYYAEQHITTLDLALDAYKDFIKKNKDFDTSKINNLVFVTETNKYDFPGNSFLFASRLNLKTATRLYDLNLGCTGFVEALDLVFKLNGNSLIVCAETYSKHIKKFNKSISPLFSDAGSVFYLNKKDILKISTFRFFKKNSYNTLLSKNKNLSMDGKAVFDFVNSEVVNKLILILNKNKKIKILFIHQASLLVCDLIKEKLKKYNLIIPRNINKIGNTVSASIPHLISDFLKKKRLKITLKS